MSNRSAESTRQPGRAKAAKLLAVALPALSTALIPGVPHVEQKPDFCGEACVAMWLGKLGVPGDQDWVFEQTGVDPREGRGAFTPDLKRAVERIGFDPGPVWYSVRAGNAAELSALFTGLHEDLARGVPSIVCMRTKAGRGATEHFRLVTGYDEERDELVYQEPAEEQGGGRRMAREKFLDLWPLKYGAERWTVIRLRLDARSVKGGRVSSHPSAADLAQHVIAAKERAGEGFSVALAPPFVILSDAGQAEADRWARGTVAWARDRLKAAYFERDPDHLLDVWLFKDAASYSRNAKRLFGESPDTPYGYYSPTQNALVMNIATGGGTLVHELVHPFVHANFPEAPAWFNEGLGSLYEQSSERAGAIVGLTNWRLAGLQQAIRAGQLPAFRTMIEGGDDAFYASDTGYAQARYLLYWLQEKGLLGAYYKRFHGARRADRTGYRSLLEVMGEKDLRGFQGRWEEWVLGLRFEG
jgi:hypothetical protein